MKRFFTTYLGIMVFMAVSVAQSPQKFSYQAVIKDAKGNVVANRTVSVCISVLQGASGGLDVYKESHSVKTNSNGLMSLQIGDGLPINGSFSAIDWKKGPFFLKTEVDPDGGNNMSLLTVQQLLSVPYALYAESAGNAVEKNYVDSLCLALLNYLQNQSVELKNYMDSVLNESLKTAYDSILKQMVGKDYVDSQYLALNYYLQKGDSLLKRYMDPRAPRCPWSF